MDKVIYPNIHVDIINFLSNLPGCAHRYPEPVSPWLNLARLMTPTSWAWILASLATVALCFNVSSWVVKRRMGMRLENHRRSRVIF